MATINGDSNSNSITGTSSDDTLSGNGGNDTIVGRGGDDAIFGGTGSDFLSGEAGNDTVDGGTGNDLAGGGEGSDTLYGGDGIDQLVGDAILYVPGTFASSSTSGPATTLTLINNADGPIELWWIEPNGTLTFYQSIPAGATGTQTTFENHNWMVRDEDGFFLRIIEGAPNQTITYGTETNDEIFGGANDDSLSGQFGDDSLYGGFGNDTIRGGYGDDILQGEQGNDTLFGDAGNDTFNLSNAAENDTIFGGDGSDRLNFVSNSDASVVLTSTGAGSYTQTGNTTGQFSGIEEIFTAGGNDTVTVTNDPVGTTINTGAGNDTITGGSGADVITYGSGNDTAFGGAGDDIIASGSSSFADNNTVYGGAGNDSLEGGAGSDTLIGGDGNDTLTGGLGEDRFVLSNGGDADVVTDFSLADSNSDGFYDDQIDVSDLIGGTGPGGAVRTNDVMVSDVGGNALLTFPGGETLLLQGVAPSQMQSGAQQRSAGIPCFTAGTLIRTPKGDVAVETLTAGDLVCTIDNGPQPVVWVGHKTLNAQDLRRRPDLAPVHIEAGALGNRTTLRVSPQHGLLLRTKGRGGGEHLVRAKHLAQMQGGRVRIARGVTSVCYVHLMFETHQAVLSNGIASESFYPGEMGLAALAPDVSRSVVALFPDLARKPAAKCYGPTARPFFKGGQLAQRLADAGALLCA